LYFLPEASCIYSTAGAHASDDAGADADDPVTSSFSEELFFQVIHRKPLDQKVVALAPAVAQRFKGSHIAVSVHSLLGTPDKDEVQVFAKATDTGDDACLVSILDSGKLLGSREAWWVFVLCSVIMCVMIGEREREGGREREIERERDREREGERERETEVCPVSLSVSGGQQAYALHMPCKSNPVRF
jgi:hypothetical protein